MFNSRNSLVALIGLLIFFTAEARAQTFNITDVQGAAYVSTSRDGGPPTLKLGPVFQFTGPGLTVWSQLPTGDPGFVEARDTCSPCTPGQVIGTNSSFSGLIGSGFFTSARVNGVFYSAVNVTGSLSFYSGPIAVPSLSEGSSVTIPFTFTGELTGNAWQPDVVNPVFVATLSGHGRARFRFELLGFDVVNQHFKLEEIEYLFEPLLIAIDVKPGTFPNTVNPNSRGRMTVAIMTTPSFDATTVDPATIHFGATGNEAAAVQFTLQDVNGDGAMDMLVHFVTPDTDIICGSKYASLTAATFGGVQVKGFDSLQTVGCK